MGVIKVLDRTGHTQIEWPSAVTSPSDEAKVKEASNAFDNATRQGMSGFVRQAGEKGAVRSDRFDQTAEEITMIPQMRGG